MSSVRSTARGRKNTKPAGSNTGRKALINGVVYDQETSSCAKFDGPPSTNGAHHHDRRGCGRS